MNQIPSQVQAIQTVARSLRRGDPAAAQRALDAVYRVLDQDAHHRLSDMCLAEYVSSFHGRGVKRVCRRRLRHRGNHKAAGRLT